MQLQITHHTRYDYAPAVSIAQHMAYLQPRNTECQNLQAFKLLVDPAPAHQNSTADVFGNTRHFFALQAPHTQLTVQAYSIVLTQPPLQQRSSVPWEQVRDNFVYRADAPFDAAAEFAFFSPHVLRHSDFADYARPSFAPGAALADCARDLMQRIHSDFTYESQSTQVNTPALQALNQRKGVCQDFAHIMIACLRSMGVAARYVSGYLLTQPAPGQARLVGSDASHAWVSVYLPDQACLPGHSAWCDFDPTNNRDGWGTPGEDYVTVAWGRDFADVSPLRGVIHGGAQHTLSVGVTVEPLVAWGSMSQSQTQGQGQSQSQSQSQIQN